MTMELTLQQESSFTAQFSTEREGWKKIRLIYRATGRRNLYAVDLDGESLSGVFLPAGGEERTAVTLRLPAGAHELRLSRREGDAQILQVLLEDAEPAVLPPARTGLSDPAASPAARGLMALLGSLYGKRVLLGQHTKDIPMGEIAFIERVTGKKPAVCGFELLGYSPNIQWETSDEPTVTEARNNQNTIPCALDWAEQGGIVAYCWHWFSPLSGNDKAFYTEHTDFDARRAVEPGTPEHEAAIRDMDAIAQHLKVFAERDIPILWRPLHEAEGGWFWWGAQGPEPCKALWREMYDRFTRVHGLHNLIWVWNSLDPAWYPGDDCVDIVAADLYAKAGNYGSCKCDFDYARALCADGKMVALSECGANPDPERCVQAGAPWLWQMTWCGGFCTGGAWNSVQQYRRAYESPYAVTLEDLKALRGRE